MTKNNFNFKFVLIFLVFFLIGAIYLVRKEFVLTQEEINNLVQEHSFSQEESREKEIIYLVDKGEGEIRSYLMIPSHNSTVFSLLEELSEKENFKIEFTVYSGMGVFVESINGLNNGTENKYWQYWVNEELSMTAADKKKVKSGDKIEWKFAPASF